MADDYQTICLQRADAVATLTLNRPQRLNAINKQMLAELQHALETVERDPDLRALVVNGAGGNFSSGFDLSEQMEARPSGVEVWRAILERDFNTVTRFWHFSKPTIAAVNGYCLAGGCELALCCDITLASGDAIFGIEIRGWNRRHDPAVVGWTQTRQGNHFARHGPHFRTRGA
jgi:enoyl-CoA hydratase/carnithine racemase